MNMQLLTLTFYGMQLES